MHSRLLTHNQIVVAARNSKKWQQFIIFRFVAERPLFCCLRLNRQPDTYTCSLIYFKWFFDTIASGSRWGELIQSKMERFVDGVLENWTILMHNESKSVVIFHQKHRFECTINPIHWCNLCNELKRFGVHFDEYFVCGFSPFNPVFSRIFLSFVKMIVASVPQTL